MREIHHRVKNILQVILSLLSVQSENVRDPAARAVITESESRIRSVSLIHERLYRSLKLGGIDFAEYVNDLCVHLFHSFGAAAKGVRLELPTHGNLKWVSTSGMEAYDTASGDLEVGDYAQEADGSYISNVPAYTYTDATSSVPIPAHIATSKTDPTVAAQ